MGRHAALPFQDILWRLLLGAARKVFLDRKIFDEESSEAGGVGRLVFETWR
jgi:hypothetical protein